MHNTSLLFEDTERLQFNDKNYQSNNENHSAYTQTNLGMVSTSQSWRSAMTNVRISEGAWYFELSTIKVNNETLDTMRNDNNNNNRNQTNFSDKYINEKSNNDRKNGNFNVRNISPVVAIGIGRK
ncbi:uncharacterized protein ASCRUDRAFT_10758 [Ascoidea rubescens DSM 1968]|uniref:Uncharacterized protein n=1 Tax=Ascoidea rubescens DSM 1968 TaxID=1344418 RepID=A0A1D2V7Z1_9ASCO|nr:hypothetical protein ASCRUDRAFT_10758 [Ascoidea rubescens DSM 1968]ODV57794.1 hypothetical protein ASCRUDRAFT_10758 [Ascoidea rubescens DSM 1968]